MARTGTKEDATAAPPKATVALAGAIVKKKKKKTSGVEGVAASGVEKKPLKAKKPAADAAAAGEAAAAGGEGEKKLKKRRKKSASGSADAGSASVPEVPDAGAAEAAPPPRRGGERVACTLFVGQLPYNSTAEEVKAHFLAVCSPPIHVRLLTHKTGGSRGMAFVELGSESDVHSALRLHHSCIYGRRINVERTVGGGNSGENRSTKLATLREKQGAVVVKAVRDLVEAALPPAAEVQHLRTWGLFLAYLVTPPGIAPAQAAALDDSDVLACLLAHTPISTAPAHLEGTYRCIYSTSHRHSTCASSSS